MKACSACSRELSRESFSKKQWQMKRFRRCKECIDGHREIENPTEERTDQKLQRTEHPTENEGASCWICLEEEEGGRLRRDCSCRGGSGYAHLSCLVDYAKAKFLGTNIIAEANRPWEECPNCKQAYMGDLGVDLASEYLSFVETTYPGSQSKIVEAMDHKLDALKRRLDHEDLAFPTKKRIEVEKLARRILSIVRRENSKYAVPPWPIPRSFLIEERATFIVGTILLGMGQWDSAKARDASECFKKCIEIGNKMGGGKGVDEAEEALDLARSLSDGYTDSDIRKLRRTYQEQVNKCRDHDDTLTAGLALAGALKSTAHTIEAERLLMNSAADSKRLHGPDHPMTREFESNLRACKRRHVTMVHRGKQQLFQALEYNDDGSKYVVRGPMRQKSSKGELRNVAEYSVPTANILPVDGTPVMCIGLKRSVHLNGRIGDVRGRNERINALEVHFDLAPEHQQRIFAHESLGACLVKPENLLILFDIRDARLKMTGSELSELARQILNED
ncbi:hypothetical protein ACHAXT_003516 [Thalassiosira profunda]